MPEDLSVLVVVPFLEGDSRKVLLECCETHLAQTYHGGVRVVVLDRTVENVLAKGVPGCSVVHTPGGLASGGAFLDILRAWMESPSRYLSFCSSSTSSVKHRFQAQTELIEGFSLGGCYGDVAIVDDSSRVVRVERAKPFSAGMLGLNCFSVESMVLDGRKFSEAGGFDHLVAAGYRPAVYLSVMAALGGPLRHLDDVVIHCSSEAEILDRRMPGLLGWDDERSEEAWRRIRFETFVSRARQFVGERG